MVRDITVNVNRFTSAVSQAGFNLPLILSTTHTAQAYAEFTSIADVAVVYPNTTEAYKMANAMFAQGLDKVAILGIEYETGVDPVSDLTTALTTLQQTQNDWYFLTCEEQGDADITELSTNFIGGNDKLYFADSTTLALAAALTSARTAILAKDDVTDYPASAWIGKCSPFRPGTITWKFKELTGVAADTTITEAQITQLHTDGGNAYISALGRNYTSEGQVTNNEFIDILRAADYLEARITEALFLLFLNSPKVPYTQQGIDSIAGSFIGVLAQAASDGILATDDSGAGLYTTVIPDIDDVPAADKAARTLNGISANAVISGAVHDVEVTLNLVLQL